MLLAHLRKGFTRPCMRGTGWAGLEFWVGPVVLARDGVVASRLPRPRGTLAWEEYVFLDETLVFAPGCMSLPVPCKGNSWGLCWSGLGFFWGSWGGGEGGFGVLGSKGK